MRFPVTAAALIVVGSLFAGTAHAFAFNAASVDSGGEGEDEGIDTAIGAFDDDAVEPAPAFDEEASKGCGDGEASALVGLLGLAGLGTLSRRHRRQA